MTRHHQNETLLRQHGQERPEYSPSHPFSCMAAYLIGFGYTQLFKRTFSTFLVTVNAVFRLFLRISEIKIGFSTLTREKQQVKVENRRMSQRKNKRGGESDDESEKMEA